MFFIFFLSSVIFNDVLRVITNTGRVKSSLASTFCCHYDQITYPVQLGDDFNSLPTYKSGLSKIDVLHADHEDADQPTPSQHST